MGKNDMGITPVRGASSGIGKATEASQTGNAKWKGVPTRTVDVGGLPFAYRELGPDSGVPVSFSTTGRLCLRFSTSSPIELIGSTSSSNEFPRIR